MSDTKSKARSKFSPLESPCPEPTDLTVNREIWIQELFEGFVQPSKANKEYYRVVVKTLWPAGHGIPGPHVTEVEIRDAIDGFRKENQYGKNPNKPYVDVFRRVRELQGEEGLTGVARQGKTFQLVSLDVSEKRIPRTKLNDKSWQKIKASYGHSCAVCKKKEPEVRFQQDHKIPRTRPNSSDDDSNWQPLCDECNNFKSTSCRGCKLDCKFCCWAFPEKYAPLILAPELLSAFRAHAQNLGQDASSLLNELVLQFLNEH